MNVCYSVNEGFSPYMLVSIIYKIKYLISSLHV